MRQFRSAIKNIGKISLCSLGFFRNAAYNGNVYKYKRDSLSKPPTAKQLEWLHLIIEEKDGTVIPDNSTVLRLAYHGLIKIEATKEGKEYFEKGGRAQILVKYLEKL